MVIDALVVSCSSNLVFYAQSTIAVISGRLSLADRVINQVFEV